MGKINEAGALSFGRILGADNQYQAGKACPLMFPEGFPAAASMRTGTEKKRGIGN